jgi:dienelactone hydrolase
VTSLAIEGASRPFDSTAIAPLSLDIAAEITGRPVAFRSVSRRYVADGVRVTVLRDPRRSGLLFEPPADQPRPGVIVPGGSSGGLLFAGQVAALLASHGFVGLALAYFGREELPQHLIEIPLEYFGGAIDWFTRLAPVRSDAIALMGMSRGAELALVLGSRLPSIRSVVAYCPSHVVWNGLRGDRPAEASAWTASGEPMPFWSLMAPRLSLARAQAFSASPIPLAPLFEAALEEEPPPAAVIPVERTNGPILLVSGEADQMWPATRMGERIMQRLASHAHPFRSRHVHYPNAGHLMRAPGVSTQVLHGQFAFGGESAAQAAANRAAWSETLTFLTESLGRPAVDAVDALAGGR